MNLTLKDKIVIIYYEDNQVTLNINYGGIKIADSRVSIFDIEPEQKIDIFNFDKILSISIKNEEDN